MAALHNSLLNHKIRDGYGAFWPGVSLERCMKHSQGKSEQRGTLSLTVQVTWKGPEISFGKRLDKAGIM